MCELLHVWRQILLRLTAICFRLSLSTTFGGSPVAAMSPFCLMVANMNTLMAQFLFVFLSGAGELLSPCCLKLRVRT